MLNLNQSTRKELTRKEVVANSSNSSTCSHAMCVYCPPPQKEKTKEHPPQKEKSKEK